MDISSHTIDFRLTAKWDATVVLRFFRKAINTTANLRSIRAKSGANREAMATLNVDKPDEEIIAIRQNKYLNERVAQDQRNIKRLEPALTQSQKCDVAVVMSVE